MDGDLQELLLGWYRQFVGTRRGRGILARIPSSFFFYSGFLGIAFKYAIPHGIKPMCSQLRTLWPGYVLTILAVSCPRLPPKGILQWAKVLRSRV